MSNTSGAPVDWAETAIDIVAWALAQANGKNQPDAAANIAAWVAVQALMHQPAILACLAEAAQCRRASA